MSNANDELHYDQYQLSSFESQAKEDVAAKACTKFCNCPNSEPGKISADIRSHLPDCHIRKRLQSGRYTVDTCITPKKISDGYSLCVVLGQEDF